MTCLLFPGLTVHGANAISCPLVIGYPAMTAFNGLAHHITRQTRTAVGLALQVKGFAVLHHGSQIRAHGQWRNRLTQKRFVHTDARTRKTGDRAHYMLSPSAEAMPELDLRFSLVIDVSAEVGLGTAIKDLERGVTTSLLGPKAFGGTVQTVGDVQFHEELSAAVKAVPSCFVLFDRSLELLSTEADPLNRLLDLLTEQVEYNPQKFRRLTPLQTGWRPISAQAWRETPRGDGLHCFAEPLIGLGEFVPRYMGIGNLDDAIWRPQISSTLFTVKGQQHG